MFTGIDVDIIASGSTGNCYRISDGSTPLLIECGIPIKKIKEGLNFKLSEIQGCLVSHSHMDHCKASKDVAMAGIDVYMSLPTAKTLGLNGGQGIRIIDPGEPPLKIGTWRVKGFKTEHDCEGSLGFYMTSTTANKTLVFLSDSYYSRYKFENVTHWMIEVNWDKKTLNKRVDSGEIDDSLLKRLMHSHMSLDTAVDLFRANDLSLTEKIYVIHVSKENADPEHIKKTLQRETGKLIII